MKPHSSEESEDQVVEGERDNDDNDEYVYYLLMERAPQDADDGMGDGVGWLGGR